jgi:SAM-dependent methyltransferase
MIVNKIKNKINSSKRKRHSLVGPPEYWKYKREFQFNFLINQGLQKQHKFLDYGCGTLRGGIPIIKYLYSGNYLGLDIRKEVIIEAKKELNSNFIFFKKPTLEVISEINTDSFKSYCDFGIAFSVFMHLTDNIIEQTIRTISQILKANGVFFANVNIGDTNYADNWYNFPVVWRELDFYVEMGNKYNLSIKKLDTLSILGHNVGDKNQDNQVMLKLTKA